MSQDEGEQPHNGVNHANPVLAGKMGQAAGVLTYLKEEGSQLRDSAGFKPDFPRYLLGLTPRGTGF